MLQPNQIFAGRYRVIRHIADGGMGAVYEAEHTTTEARVALKLLLPQMMLVANARRRFELEAKVAARVNSEHIVKVFDAGVATDTGSPYLAMELLTGETLAARVRNAGRLEPHTVIEILRQVARGLDAAHGYRTVEGERQPIVHRDLKPENLFLARRGDGNLLVKVLDFGIAKVLSESTEVSQQVRGTPLYMAFEQAAGEAVSPQTDIWALGLVAYFALTGRRYWPAASKATGSTEALFAEILTLPLPRPSQRAQEEGLDVVLPSAFDHWLLTCLDRTPSRRFGSAGLAVDALERALASSGGAPAPVVRAGPLRSRVTAAFERPSAIASSGNSVTSVPPVASERGRSARAGSARFKWSAAVGLACLGGAAAAWSVSRTGLWGASRPTSPAADAAAARERVDENPAVLPRPRPVDGSTPERSGARVTTNASDGAEPSRESPAALPGPGRRPEVKVVESPVAADTAPTPPPSGRSPAATTTVQKLPRTEPPAASATPAPERPRRPPSGVPEPLPPAGPAAASPGPAAAPPGPAAAPASCDTFDPYTGRCAAASAVAAPSR